MNERRERICFIISWCSDHFKDYFKIISDYCLINNRCLLQCDHPPVIVQVESNCVDKVLYLSFFPGMLLHEKAVLCLNCHTCIQYFILMLSWYGMLTVGKRFSMSWRKNDEKNVERVWRITIYIARQTDWLTDARTDGQTEWQTDRQYAARFALILFIFVCFGFKYYISIIFLFMPFC